MEKMQGGGSAVILKFPVGGRKALATYRRPEADAYDMPGFDQDICDAASGGAWYHDEAMRETDAGRKG